MSVYLSQSMVHSNTERYSASSVDEMTVFVGEEPRIDPDSDFAVIVTPDQKKGEFESSKYIQELDQLWKDGTPFDVVIETKGKEQNKHFRGCSFGKDSFPNWEYMELCEF